MVDLKQARTGLAEVSKDIEARNAKRSELESFLNLLDGREGLLTEFDEALWLGIVDKMKVDAEGGVTFVLKDGNKVIRTITI